MLDAETALRGVTLYGPDERAALHPEILSEAAASLLAGQRRPCLLWRIDLDAEGVPVDADISRAWVQVRANISYHEAQAAIDGPDTPPLLAALAEIGRLRTVQELARGAVSLSLPDQEITEVDNGRYRLHYDATLPVETWNAQISLLTGIVAADKMLECGHGLLRTLPTPEPETIDQLRLVAQGLHVSWKAKEGYADRVRRLDPKQPAEAALMVSAARTLGGAGYAAFGPGMDVPEDPTHAAIASTYAHVTAPLRRVCDRYANEILIAAATGRDTPEWVYQRLGDLPSLMADARRRERNYERTVIDFMEALVLADHVGATFEAMVVGRNRKRLSIQLPEPPVIAFADDNGRARPGTWVNVRLDTVDPDRRSTQWSITS